MQFFDKVPRLRNIALTAAAVTGTLFLIITLPAHADEGDQSSESQLDNIAETEGTDTQTDDAQITLNSLDRSTTGSAIALTYTVHNTGETQIDNTFLVSNIEIYESSAFSDVTLFDPESEARHYPLANEEERCICAADSRIPEFVDIINPETSTTYWSLYQIPDDVDSVTVEIPAYEDIDDVAISDL